MLRRLGLLGVAGVAALVIASACGGDSDVDFNENPDGAAGSAGATGGSGGATGGTGGATGGSAGVATGGSAGVATGGSAGVATGGSAGVATGGSAGATGGSAGVDGGTQLPLGSPCTTKDQCASGSCADGVCCDTACSGTCEACDSEGACKPVAPNTDPSDECGACKVCDGASACVAVPDGTDPNEECATQDPTSCGTTGSCKTGKCELYGAFTVCEKGQCSVSTLTAKLCNGNGACGAVGTVSCSPYTCNETLDGCRTTCSTDAHCVTGVQCDEGKGICLANLPKGASCTQSSQCASGFCRDGVCCDKACNGFCEACNLAGSVGDCKPHASGTDPSNECGGQSTCNGTCDGSGGCSWPSAISCTPQSGCLGGKTGPGQCNGYGSCLPTNPCPGNYACSSFSSCGTLCYQDQHCQKGYGCVIPSGSTTGTCQKGTLTDGDACTSEGSCISGDCGDFFQTADCSTANVCVGCDQDSDCPSGRCDDCKCQDRLKSGGTCNETSDCLSGYCNAGKCQ